MRSANDERNDANMREDEPRKAKNWILDAKSVRSSNTRRPSFKKHAAIGSFPRNSFAFYLLAILSLKY